METRALSRARFTTSLRTIGMPAIVLSLIAAPFLLFGAQIEEWVRVLVAHPAGAWTQALCVLLLASDVLLPVPSSVVSTACGMAWGIGIGAALSTLGMTLGSCLGYGLGRWAGGAARWMPDGQRARLEELFARHGAWVIVLLRPAPVLAEASAVFAGISRMPAGRFLALSACANLIVSLFYALGAWAIGRLAPGGPAIVLIVLLALAAVPWSRSRRR